MSPPTTTSGHMELFKVLKGPKRLDNGIMDEPTVSVFVEGSRDVVTAGQWPTNKVEYRPFYLLPRRKLSAEPERMGTEHAVPDGFYQAPLTVTDKVEILSWRTEPVVEPVEMFATGAAHLFVEIDQPDTNLILRLWDEAPRGDRQLVTTGFLMASHHEFARSAAARATRTTTRTHGRFRLTRGGGGVRRRDGTR